MVKEYQKAASVIKYGFMSIVKRMAYRIHRLLEISSFHTLFTEKKIKNSKPLMIDGVITNISKYKNKKQ